MSKIISTILAIAISGFFALSVSSCNNAKQSNKGNATDSSASDSKRIDSLTANKRKTIEFKFVTLEANLPAPFAIVNDIYSYNLPYMGELLNNPANVSKYTSDFSKEVNYGIYGLDMGYTSFYGGSKDLLDFYNSAKTLSQQLNLSKIFDGFTDRFKANAGNKDSIIVLVDRIYGETDDYLKKNDRYLAASHIIAGALIELDYISLNLLKGVKLTPENTPLFEKVYNENLYIDFLKKLYVEYKDEDSKNLLAAMTEYTKGFNDVIHMTSDMTPEHVDKAIELIGKLRNNLIK